MKRDGGSGSERRLVDEMSALSVRVLKPGERRVYELLIEGVDPFTDLIPLENAGRAYQIWAAISDLVGAPDGPHSEEACASMARQAAREWLAVDHASRGSVDAYFRRWLGRVGVRE